MQSSFDPEKLAFINACSDTEALNEFYMNSNSFVERCHALMRLSQFNSTEMDVDDKPLGVRLNNFLRYFTKQKDWVNVRLGKVFV